VIFPVIICSAQPENIRISYESGIEELMAKHIHFNEVVKTIPGYRLQIFSGSGNYSKSNAVGERSRFMGKYPQIQAYVVFNTPYYMVRAGNFRTRLEVEAFRQLVLDTYPEAYIVRDEIDLPGRD
jgi:hypothetical protein